MNFPNQNEASNQGSVQGTLLNFQPHQKMASLNAMGLAREAKWFSDVLTVRIQLYFMQETEFESIEQLSPPDVRGDHCAYAELVRRYELSAEQRLIVMLALLPHIQPQALDTFFIRNANLDRGYTEFGGLLGKNHSGFLPTCETAVFLLAGDDLDKRFAASDFLQREHLLFRAGILELEAHPNGEPLMSGALTVSSHYLHLLTRGGAETREYSLNFPAKRIESPLDWADLVLAQDTRFEVARLITWGKHSKILMKTWGLEKVLKPGYRALFYGPPGTGKTLTATLIGRQIECDVYRIDLSAMISKYIGETEKNLESLFQQAQNKNWILFFDEADALFGKRSMGSSANDRHSNQEIAYLLQRIEDFPGIVILATNLKANIDEAFARRFQSVVYFPMPEEHQRLKLWESSLNGRLDPADMGNLADLAKRHVLSGGAITNVVRYAALCALMEDLERDTIRYRDLEQGVLQELRKEGKLV